MSHTMSHLEHASRLSDPKFITVCTASLVLLDANSFAREKTLCPKLQRPLNTILNHDDENTNTSTRMLSLDLWSTRSFMDLCNRNTWRQDELRLGLQSSWWRLCRKLGGEKTNGVKSVRK